MEGNELWLYKDVTYKLFLPIIVGMLTKEKRGEHKKGWSKNIYIQVTETRYKWTWLNSS